MPNELPLPDDLGHLIEKRSGRDRRRKERGHSEDEDDQSARAPADRRREQRHRRGHQNYRDLLNDEADDG